jgi:hypothetical protein
MPADGRPRETIGKTETGPDSRTASLSILTPGQAGVEKERGLIRTNLEGSGCYTPPIRLSWPFRSWAGWRRSRSFTGARIIDAATLEAWRQIDAGRRTATADTVAVGNRTLLFREQHDIIDRYYVRTLGTGRLARRSRTW